MTGEQLRAAIAEIYERGGQTKLARRLKVDGSTVRRWLSGAASIPGPAVAAVEMMLEQKRSGA